jgi:hypothetical protein
LDQAGLFLEFLIHEYHLDSPASRKPHFFRKNIAGHQLVKADWKRFSPTKPVNQYQFGFTVIPRVTDTRMTNPAINLNPRSTVIVCLLFYSSIGAALAGRG